MKEKADYKIHIICMTAVFVLGNAVICTPYQAANRYNFSGFLTAFFLSLLMLFPVLFIVDFLFDDKRRKEKYAEVLMPVIFILGALAAVITAAYTFADYTEFVTRIMLPKTPTVIISVIFFLIVYFLGVKRDTVLLKFSLFAFLICVIVAVLFFILSFPRMQFSNIIIYHAPSYKTLLTQSKPYFTRTFVAVIPVLVYRKTAAEKISVRQSVRGFIAGSLILGLCILNSLAVFGPYMAQSVEFPYAAAISTVSVGELFTRMDLFAYFLFFTSALLKIAVSISLIRHLAEDAGIKYKRTVCFIGAAAISVLGGILR